MDVGEAKNQAGTGRYERPSKERRRHLATPMVLSYRIRLWLHSPDLHTWLLLGGLAWRFFLRHLL